MSILSQNQDENNAERKFFIMLPNIIDDLPLSLAAFRLYIHIRRITGDNGICWQSLSTLAQHCGLSRKTVIKAKRELQRFGLIKIEPKKRDKGGHDYHEIFVTDIWEVNALHYEGGDENDKVKKNTPCKV